MGHITEVDGVIGVKQSAGDMKLLADLLLLLDGKGVVFAAVDALLYPCYMLGAHGSIAAILAAALVFTSILQRHTTRALTDAGIEETEQAELAATRLEEVLSLADVRHLALLRSRAKSLWPARPEKLSALETVTLFSQGDTIDEARGTAMPVTRTRDSSMAR